MSNEKTVSIYDYKPEHFGDTILEGVIVRDIQTFTHGPPWAVTGVSWSWRTDQGPSVWLGPYTDHRTNFVVDGPITRAVVMDDIAHLIRALLAEGHLRADAFDEVA